MRKNIKNGTRNSIRQPLHWETEKNKYHTLQSAGISYLAYQNPFFFLGSWLKLPRILKRICSFLGLLPSKTNCKMGCLKRLLYYKRQILKYGILPFMVTSSILNILSSPNKGVDRGQTGDSHQCRLCLQPTEQWNGGACHQWGIPRSHKSSDRRKHTSISGIFIFPFLWQGLVLISMKFWNLTQDYPSSEQSLALVIDGGTLVYAMEEQCRLRLLELATRCVSVIACRVSPIQKANFLQTHFKLTTYWQFPFTKGWDR